jgi:signal transduction histidine kinase
MKMRPRSPSVKNGSVILVLVIVIIAASLSVASYEYVNSISNGIENSSIASTNTNAQIEVAEIDHILVNQMLTVASNVRTLSVSGPVQTNDTVAAIPLFAAAQNTTSEITSTYFWISADGNLLVARNSTGGVPAPLEANLTQRPFFKAVEQSGAPYFGDVILSLHLVPEVDIAWPVFNQTVIDGQTVRTFEGIVGASVDVSTLGSFLQAQLPGKLNTSLGAIDPQGVLLYTTDQSLLGLSIFGPQFQSVLPAGLKTSFDSFLLLSIKGGSGIYDLSYNGSRTSIAYQSVLINATVGQTKPVFFAVLYVLASDVLAANDATQINLLRLFFAGSVVLIGVSGVVSAAVVLNWNNRLEKTIKKRTADLVAANAELAEQSKAQKDLINIAAHELRTPAQSILANSELLQDALGPPKQRASAVATSGSQASVPGPTSAMSDSDVQDLVDSTFRNAQRLQKITNNLLEVARIDTKNVKIELEVFDLNEKITRVIGDLEKVLPMDKQDSKDVRIIFEPKEPVLSVRSDMTKTYEILSNLLRNAVRHSKPGGKITVSSERTGAFALVRVVDEGTGIDEALLPRLFEKFATSAGTGLGLFISKSYVESIGGKIWAQNNEGPGESGATFSFTLPLAE